MCTNFALIKKDGTARLAERLGVDPAAFRYSADFRPGNTVSIVVERDGTRQVRDAIWWLYLRQTDRGLKPHPDYFSVNTNYARLATKAEYRTSRCILPASAFVESQSGKNPHLLEPEDGSAIAFGGLWKTWVDKTTGELVCSASIITLPGHPSLANIHKKSIPLWLPADEYDRWLDPDFRDIDALASLLTPTLRQNLRATPIDRATSKVAVGAAFTIDAA